MKITSYTFRKCALLPLGQYKRNYFCTDCEQSIGLTFEGGAFKRFVIPKGFITDLASTPSMFQFVYSKAEDEARTNAAILHDFLYCKNNGYEHVTKKEADDMLVALLRVSEHPSYKCRLVSMSMAFTGSHWRKESVRIWNEQKQKVT